MRAAACAVALGAALALAGAAQASNGGVLRARFGSVSARITFRFEGPFAKDIRVQIRREGVKLLDRKLRKVYDLPVGLRVRDLNADDEPEVLADFYTGGAQCCRYSLVYRFTGTRYQGLKHPWGNSEYKLADLDGDGKLEFRSYDDRFAYVFSAYAGSAFPVQVWAYRHGKLKDRTRRYPKAVKKDARRLWKAYRKERRRREGDVRGILAAWMADQYLLGHRRTGWAKLRAANRRGELHGTGPGDVWPKGTRYLAALRTFLRKNGYAR